MLLSNGFIYSTAITLSKIDFNDMMMPVRIGFFLQKNINAIMSAAKEIDDARSKILQTYGSLDPVTEQYSIPNDNINVAQRELDDLMSLEQELQIHQLPLSNFDGISFDAKCISAIMFMIDED